MEAVRMFFVLFMMVSSVLVKAQDPLTLLGKKDTTKVVHIAYDQIPAASIEAIFRFEEILSSLITPDELSREATLTDSLLSHVDSLLMVDDTLHFERLLLRNLLNKQNFWIGYKGLLKKRQDQLSAIVGDLSSQRDKVIGDEKLWRHTKLSVDSAFVDTLIDQSINEVLLQADMVRREILSKSNEVFVLLKRLTQRVLLVDGLLSEMESIRKQQQEISLAKTQPALWEKQFWGNYSGGSNGDLLVFVEENSRAIFSFYQKNKDRLFVFFGFLLILLGGFIMLSRKGNHYQSQCDNYFKQSATTIVQRPLGVSIILGVFFSGLFLPNRPPILIDLAILVLIVPLVDVVAQVAKRAELKYLIVFGLLVLLRFANYVFHPGNPVHRVIMLVLAIAEIVLIIRLIRHFNLRSIRSLTFGYFVRVILLFHLFAAFIGLVATVTGHLTLAEVAVDLAISNSFVGLLLIVSSLTLIGLMHLLVDGDWLKKLNFLKRHNQLIKRRIALFIILFASLFWLDSVLQILKVRDPFLHFVMALFTTEVSLGVIKFRMGSVLLFFSIIYISILVSGMIRSILEDDVLNNVSLRKGVPRMISVVIRFSLISVGVILAVSAVGMPLSQLTILFSAFSVGIGFGLQNIVNNFVSGVILLFERPIQIGDAVEIGNLVGTIKSMGIRSSKVRTYDGAEVIVPNANLISNELINWTLSDKRRRIEIISGVAYGSDVYQTQKILLEILQSHPDILKNPQPMVLFNNLGESSLDFRLLFWTDDFDNWVVIKSEITFKIYDALTAAGIEIPFPQRDLHIRTMPGNQLSVNSDQ